MHTPLRVVSIDTNLVRHLIETQFPQWAHLDIKPVERSGWDNRTFLLGDGMSVRLPSAEGYAPQAEKEQRWLPILAPQLPLPVPTLVIGGEPDALFPWKWGVYRWIDGEPANSGHIADLSEFAVSLADFLRNLQQIDITGAPLAGPHSAFRGAPLSVYDEETRKAITQLRSIVNADLALTIWNDALSTTWDKSPVWFHGDVAAGNLLVRSGRLHAVIDFGCCGVGDPACDLVIAWTLLRGESRAVFREELNVDEGTWARGRGWALWKALITVQEYRNAVNEPKRMDAWNTLDELFGEYV